MNVLTQLLHHSHPRQQGVSIDHAIAPRRLLVWNIPQQDPVPPTKYLLWIGAVLHCVERGGSLLGFGRDITRLQQSMNGWERLAI